MGSHSNSSRGGGSDWGGNLRKSPGVDTSLGDCPCARAESLDSGRGRLFNPSLVPFSTFVGLNTRWVTAESAESAFHDRQELRTSSVDLDAFVAQLTAVKARYRKRSNFAEWCHRTSSYCFIESGLCCCLLPTGEPVKP